MIQSVDSFKLLGIINDEASKADRIINCLLQIHIAEEETKYGFSMNELTDSLENSDIMDFKNVLICGVMGMATFTDDNKQIRKEFRYLKQCYEVLKSRYFSSYDRFREISMGMSGDYKIAVEEGSTMIRVGSLIFGERTKLKSQ
jgi:pyridoxal phosphate enzyme (YggS family)